MASMRVSTLCNIMDILISTFLCDILNEWWRNEESEFKKRQPISDRNTLSSHGSLLFIIICYFLLLCQQCKLLKLLFTKRESFRSRAIATLRSNVT